MKKLFLCIICFMVFTSVNSTSVDLAKNSKTAVLIEGSSGKILYEKNKDEKRSPASMTKIMTLLLIMEELEKGNIKLTDKVNISKNASSMGGTQIFVEENTQVSVSNLLKGIAIASANDASVAMAEHISGNEEVFVEKMNERARSLGCKNTNFKNPHGLDETDHYSSAYDMALIAKELIKYDLALKLSSTYEDNIEISGKNHWLVNTNKLVKFYKGIDGLKTGYTDKSLYCLTATMKKNDMRLISVVMGSDNKENRSSDTISMMEYGYSTYGSQTIIKKNNYSKVTFVNNAKNRKVKYYLDEDIKLIVDKNTKDIKYDLKEELDNLKAPIKANSKIGIVKLKYNNNIYEYDLIVKDDIKKANYIDVIGNNLKELITGSVK